MFSNVTANAGGTLILYGTPDIKVEWSHATSSNPNDRIVEIEGYDVNNIAYPLNSWSIPYTVQHETLDNYCLSPLTGAAPYEHLPSTITVRVYNTAGGTIEETATFTIEHRQAPSNNASLMGAQGVNWTVSSHGANGKINVCWPNFDTTSECWKGSDSWCGGQKTLNSSLAPGQWQINGTVYFKQPSTGTETLTGLCCLNNCISHTLLNNNRPQDIAYIDFSIQYTTCHSPLEYRKQSVNSSFFASPQPGGSSSGVSSQGSQPLSSTSSTTTLSSSVNLPQPIGSKTFTTTAGALTIPLCPQDVGTIYGGRNWGSGCHLGGDVAHWYGYNYCDIGGGYPTPYSYCNCPNVQNFPATCQAWGAYMLAWGELILKPTIRIDRLGPHHGPTGCCFGDYDNGVPRKVWKLKSIEDITSYSGNLGIAGFVYSKNLKAEVKWDVYAASDFGTCGCPVAVASSGYSSLCAALCGGVINNNIIIGSSYSSLPPLPAASCYTSGRCSELGFCKPSYNCPSPSAKRIASSNLCSACPTKTFKAHQGWIIDFDPCFERWDNTPNARRVSSKLPSSSSSSQGGSP